MNAKHFVFVSSFDYPTRFAHALHGLHMARAFTGILGKKFLFLINTAVDRKVLIDVPYRRLFGPFGRRIKKLHLRRVLLPFSLIPTLLFRMSGKKTVLYTTDPALYGLCAILKRFLGFSFAAECHGSLAERQERALSHADVIVFVTHALADEFLYRHPALKQKTLVLPNAVDVSAFSSVEDDKGALRAKLALPKDATLIGYIGRFEPLGRDKGLRLIIDALRDLPETHALLVGGSKAEVTEFEAYVRTAQVENRVTIVAHTDGAIVPAYAKACDILVYVPTEKHAFFERETSPMKLFEYMAAKRPIIVSDTPAIREILSDESAYFVPQGSSEHYITAVRTIIEDRKGAIEKAEKAYSLVTNNTWKTRGERLVQKLLTVIT